ncbi:MAG: ubiquitin-conjugating enzyme/RWD-like protein [Benniella sp.]|nr:MAG: ubiquitin-conjugating enzyme/RWD-like protein [Benniella sp.]
MNTISPAALRNVTLELYALRNDPPEGIRVIMNLDDITEIQAWLQGPEGTPYEGGRFKIKIQLSRDFPISPPQCVFMTKIYHPNVSNKGDVCVSTLKKDWKQNLGLRHILLVVKCLLVVPNPESALNEEAGRQLLEHYDDYAKHARLMTSIHAQSGQDIFPPSSIHTNKTQEPSSSSTTCSKSSSESSSSSSKVTNGRGSSTEHRSGQEFSSSSSSSSSVPSSASSSLIHSTRTSESFSTSRPNLTVAAAAAVISTTSISTASPTAAETSVTGHPDPLQGAAAGGGGAGGGGADGQLPLSAEPSSTESVAASATSKSFGGQEPNGTTSTTSVLKRKWIQDGGVPEQPFSKQQQQQQQQQQQNTRQTLQGLPTHHNHSPPWTSPTLKPSTAHVKSEAFKDRVHDSSVRSAMGAMATRDTKNIKECKKRSLRRL